MNIGFIPYRNSKRTPDKTVLVDKDADKSLTWSLFNDRVNRLANPFAGHGLQERRGRCGPKKGKDR